MALRWAVVCSGQGGQQAGMLDLLHADPLAWQAWQQIWQSVWPLVGPAAGELAEPALQPMPTTLADWQTHLQDGNWCYANRPAQTLIVAYQLALWQVLAPRLPPPTMVAGYSVGEIGAQVWAGSLDPQAIMPLTVKRAELMDQAANGVAQGLLAVSGGAWQHGPDWADLLSAHQAALAIDNGSAGCVIGAPATGLDSLGQYLQQRGERVQRLPVQVASHTVLMQPAYAAWQAYLTQQNWQRPRTTLLAGCDGSRLASAAALAPALARQMVAPVRWAACMDRLAEAGIDKILETGPGSALARMLQTRCPHLAVRSLADFRSPAAAVGWLERQ